MSDLDLTPPKVSWRAYEGDPFDVHIVLTVDGQTPPDLSGWTWAALIKIDGQEIPFETTAEPNGVRLYLRGDQTMRLNHYRYASFDVTGRDPQGGEGRTILRGGILATARITPPLRGRADLVKLP